MEFSRNANLTNHIKTVHQHLRPYKCDQCGKSFGEAGTRKKHIEAVHEKIRYPCTWEGCNYQATEKARVKVHVRQVHTKEWSYECQLCEDKYDIGWGCILPSVMEKHKAKKHSVEWEEEQEAYRQAHSFVCKYKRCKKRFETEVEVKRHERKLH